MKQCYSLQEGGVCSLWRSRGWCIGVRMFTFYLFHFKDHSLFWKNAFLAFFLGHRISLWWECWCGGFYSSLSVLIKQVGPLHWGPARRGSQVACRNFKMSRVGVLSRVNVAVGNWAHASYINPCRHFLIEWPSFVAISFGRCRYFLAHVACRILPWQGLMTARLERLI